MDGLGLTWTQSCSARNLSSEQPVSQQSSAGLSTIPQTKEELFCVPKENGMFLSPRSWFRAGMERRLNSIAAPDLPPDVDVFEFDQFPAAPRRFPLSL